MKKEWPLRDEHGTLVTPYEVCEVNLPWLPSDNQACVLMLAAALIQALLDDGFLSNRTLCDSVVPTELRHKLHRLMESLLILVPPSALGVTFTPEIAGSHARHYLRNLVSVISQWETCFVDTVWRSRLAFHVRLGCVDSDPVALLMDSPFQLPRGYLWFQVVPRGATDGLSFNPDGRTWRQRVLSLQGEQS